MANYDSSGVAIAISYPDCTISLTQVSTGNFAELEIRGRSGKFMPTRSPDSRSFDGYAVYLRDRHCFGPLNDNAVHTEHSKTRFGSVAFPLVIGDSDLSASRAICRCKQRVLHVHQSNVGS